MSIDLNKVTFDTPVWFKGKESRFFHLSRVENANDGHKIQWTVGIQSKEYAEYLKKDISYRKKNWFPGEQKTSIADWECYEKDCMIINSIDFIREP